MARLSLTGVRTAAGGPVDLALTDGECVVLTGPSGAGKSLLLRAVADLDPHDGLVRLDDEACPDVPAPRWRRRVGLLPAESRWWLDRVGDHLPDDVGPRLPELGLPLEALDWRVERLSTGERQRLALLRLLSGGPEALLLDEPTASVDPDNVERIERLVEAYRRERGAPTVWVTHDRGQATRVGDRVLRMDAGRLEAVR